MYYGTTKSKSIYPKNAKSNSIEFDSPESAIKLATAILKAVSDGKKRILIRASKAV